MFSAGCLSAPLRTPDAPRVPHTRHLDTTRGKGEIDKFDGQRRQRPSAQETGDRDIAYLLGGWAVGNVNIFPSIYPVKHKYDKHLQLTGVLTQLMRKAQ